jgi:hypothetical protein
MPILNLFDPSVAVNTGTDTINIAAHGFTSIQGVIYSNGGGSSVGGLVDSYKYYIIYIDPDNFRLANTEVEARAGTSVDLLTAGSGSTHRFTSTSEFPNSAAYYDFFRKFRFIGTNITEPDGYIIEADTVRDTFTFIGGTNIEFANPNTGINDSIAINGPDYDLISPLGISNGASIRLENLGVEYQDVKLTSFRGIRIDRVSNSEIEFESFGVTETDTLHTVTSRGNLTSNNLVMNNLLVGKIQSTPGIDGFINVSVSAGDAYNGDGTLDNPIVFSPDESQRTDASYTVTLDFSSPSPGTFSYVAVFNPSATLASGYVKLERKNPSTLVWETLDYLAGTVARTTYEIQNIYAELNLASTDYRITFNWTGNTEFVNYRVRLTYEVEPLAGNEIIITDTNTEVLTLGTANGTVNLRGTIGVVETLNFEGLTIFQNNIDGNLSNADVNIRPNGTGNLVVTADTDILGDLIVRGGDINTDQTTFNLLNTTATTVNAFGAANTAVIATNASSIQLGNFTLVGSIIDTDDSSGITLVPAVTMNSDLTVENDLDITRNISIGGDISIGSNISIGGDASITGNTSITGSLTVGGGIVGNSTLTVDSDAVFNSDVEIRGGDITTDQTTFNLLNTTATTVNAFGAATIIAVGSTTGTLTINNPTVVGTQTTQNIFNTVATTVNAFGAANTAAIATNASSIQLGNFTLNGSSIDTDDSSGITFVPAVTLNSDLTVENETFLNGELSVNGNTTIVGILGVGGNIDTNVGATFATFPLGEIDNFGLGIAQTGSPRNNSLGYFGFYNNAQILDNVDITYYIHYTASGADVLLGTGASIVNQTGYSATLSNTSTINTGVFIDVDNSNPANLAINSPNNAPSNLGGNLTVGGNLEVTGDLTINGTTTTLNTTTLDVEDLNITVAKGALTAAAANGAGLTVDGASATLLYASADDSWNFNKILKATSLQGTPIGTTTRAAGNFTSLAANGDVTIGDADTDTITVGGSFVTGTVLRSAKVATNTLSLAAYDVDGTAYINLITLTAGNTPTLALTSTGVGTINNMSIGATTASTGKFTTLEVRDTTTTGFDLFFASNSSTALTADRTLTFDVVNAARTVKLGANIDIAAALTLSTALTVQTGAVTLTGQAGGSSVTLPSTGTVATIAGSESLTNKKLGSLTTNGIVTTSGSDGTLSVTATTGTGSVVLATNPTLSTPTYGTGSSNVDGDFTVDAASITYFAYLQSASGTARTINVSNLTSGRSITLFLRNSNAATKVVNIAASTTTTGFGAVLMSRGAGQTAATSVTLAATSGVATITVFNIGGTFAGSIG